MESDRLLSPVFRQFYKERDVVMEERRSRVDDNPSGLVYESLISTSFQAHPNRLPVIGWQSDLESLTAEQLRTFYQTYYRPDNMVLVLVGDLEREKIEPVLEKYFSRLPQPKKPLPKISLVEPPQTGERSAKVHYKARPQIVLAYHKPVYPNPDDAQFAVLHSVLAGGRTSILYKNLVEKKQKALSLYSSEGPGELYPSIFYVSARPAPGVSNEELRDEIQAELTKLATREIPESEILKAKRKIKVGLLDSLSSFYGVARTLGKSEALWGNWEVVFEVYEQIDKTTAEDINRLAKTYFGVNNRTFVELVPEQ